MLDLDVVREIAGRYRPLRLIGQGGMGAVYEVEHLHTGQRLAMKVLNAHRHSVSVERFRREARAASRIQSDHVVRVTDADVAPELGGAPFLVMELLDGCDLERRAETSPISSSDVVEWLRQVALALDKAHQAGVVHRDLKPENLFLSRRDDGTSLVKILDFGIAKMMVTDAGALTDSGQWVGTPYYMAPEQVEDPTGPISGQVDIFAIGHIAFRLLVGRTYRAPGTLPQILVQILKHETEPPSARGATLGPAFDAWFLRSCDREPKKRFSSAAEQVEALASALGSTRSPVPRWRVSPLEAAPTIDASTVIDPSRMELPRLPCRPGECRMRIKGVAYRGMRQLIDGRIPGGLEGFVRAIDDKALAEFISQPFLTASWYDILPMMPINVAIAHILGLGLEVLAEEEGTAQARYDARTVYRTLFDAMTLDNIAMRMVRFERQYYDHGDGALEVMSPHHLVLRRLGVPEFVVRWFAPMHAAYGAEVLRLKGATQVEATPRPPTPAGVRDGLRLVDLDTDLRWSAPPPR